MCLDVVNFDGLTVGNSGGTSTEGTGTPEAAASEAQLVPEKTKKVFVVINPYTDGNKGWNLTADAVKVNLGLQLTLPLRQLLPTSLPMIIS